MRSLAISAILLSLLVVSGSASADDPVPAGQPPDETYGLYTLATVTVTAEAPQASEATATTVVTAEDIEATNAKTVAQALSYAPGVRTSTGRKNEPTVYIQGFDQSRVLVLIDGVPYYESNYGKLDLNQIPTDNVARIEVTKGPASVLYGANALGGVINIITKKSGAKTSTVLRAEGGENQAWSASASHSGKAGNVSYAVSAAHRQTKGWDLSSSFVPREGVIAYKNPTKNVKTVIEDGGMRNNSDLDATDVWAKIGLERGPDSAYFANIHYLDMEKGAPPATDSISVFRAKPKFSHFARIPVYQDWGIDLDMKEKLSDSFAVKGKLFYHDHQDDYVSYEDPWYRDEIATSQYEDFLAGGTFIGELVASKADVVRMSVNYKKDSHDERDDTYLPFADSASWTGSVGLENQLAISPKLSLVAGVSYDWLDVSEASRNVVDKSGNFLRQDELATPRQTSWNPMVGLSWKATEGSNIFVSAGRKTRFPSLSQLYSSKSGNSELKPEKTNSVVAGWNGSLASRSRLEVSGFWHDVTDLISRDGPSVTNVYMNYAKVRMAGVETSVDVFPLDWLVLHADWAWTDASDRSDDSPTDKVRNVAEHKGGAAISLTVPGVETRLDLHVIYTGETYTSLPTAKAPTDPEKRIGGYTLTDLRVGQPVGAGIEVYLNGTNLTDKSYQTEYGYPAPGRAVTLGIAAKL